MTINVEDLNDESRYSVTAFEVYPKTVSPIQMDYASKDVMKIQVSMQYKYWTSQANRVENFDATTPQQIGEYMAQNNLVPESYYNDFRNFQNQINTIEGFDIESPPSNLFI